MIKLPETAGKVFSDGGPWSDDWVSPQDAYTEAQLKQAVRDAYEDAAKVCKLLGQKYRDTYKGRTQPVDKDGLYNPHTDGLSDGAWECEEAIRTLIKEIDA